MKRKHSMKNHSTLLVCLIQVSVKCVIFFKANPSTRASQTGVYVTFVTLGCERLPLGQFFFSTPSLTFQIGFVDVN